MNIIVKGKVSFYGKVKNYNGTGDSYRLCIDKPSFRNVSRETLLAMYKDNELALKKNSFLSKLADGEEIDFFMVHSDYPVSKVFCNGESITVEEYKDKYGELFLNEAEVEMVVNKGYIGKLNIIKNGKEFNPFE